jgi:bifunctional non-homologous end joining protein LigD
MKSTTGKRQLQAYRQKRNFNATPEPSGDAVEKHQSSTDLKFCVQKHLASHLHYDFRLQHKGVLLSWAVPKGPSLNPHDKRLAVRVEPHPLDYRTFEGVIPQGYGAGIVMLWDQGTWQPESSDIDKALASGELKFSLRGVKLKGSWVLVRLGQKSSRNWLLIKHADKWSGDLDVTTAAPLSVKTFQDFHEILAQDTPAQWHSHLPAKGGAAGTLLKQIIDRAAMLKVKRDASLPKKRSSPSSRKPRKPATSSSS